MNKSSKIVKLLFIHFIAFPAILYSQQNTLDSLLILLNQQKQESPTRVELLNKISFEYRETDPEEGIETADAAVKLATKLDNKKELGEAYKNKAINLFYIDDSDGAIENLNTSVEIFKTINYKKGLGVNYRNLSIIHFAIYSDSAGYAFGELSLKIAEELNDTLNIAKASRSLAIKYSDHSEYNKSLLYWKKSLDNFTMLNDQKSIAGVVNGQGVCYMYLSDYAKALENFLASSALYETITDENENFLPLINAGIIYEKLGKYDKALIYHQKALDLVLKTNINPSNTLASISNVYSSMGNSSMALEYNERALKADREFKNIVGEVNTLINIGIIHLDNSNYEHAMNCILAALDLLTNIKSNIGLITALNTKAKIIRLAPEYILKIFKINPNEKYKLAELELGKALQLAKKTTSIEKESFVWEELSKTYLAQKKYKESLEAYQNYVQLRDSAINESTIETITRKEMQFEFEKKEAVALAEQRKNKELALAEIDKQKFRTNVFIGGIFFLVIAGSGGFMLYKRNRDSRQQQREIASTLQMKETELKALRLQMNPHFIDNALQSIQHFMNQHKAEEAEEYLVKFSSLMRAMLLNSEKEEISLANELETLEWYMQLENLRMNFPFKYQFHIAESVDCENAMVPPNILQPFVENSIKHGLLPKNSSGNINIYIQNKNSELHMIVEDDGIGRNHEKPIPQAVFFKRESLGIKITQERLNIINRLKNKHAAFRIIDLKDNNVAKGTRIELNLPFQT